MILHPQIEPPPPPADFVPLQHSASAPNFNNRPGPGTGDSAAGWLQEQTFLTVKNNNDKDFDLGKSDRYLCYTAATVIKQNNKYCNLLNEK